MANLYSTTRSKFAPWLQTADNSITADMLFEEAADKWLKTLSTEASGGVTRARRIRKNTEHGYRQNVANLKLFFGKVALQDITVDRIRSYENARLNGDEPFIRKRRPIKSAPVAPCPAGAAKVNQEVSVLTRILRIPNLWGEDQRNTHTRLKVEPTEVQRALTKDQQANWLKVASSEPSWHMIYWYSELAFATCLSTNEIRALRLCDIELEAGLLRIPWAGSKNRYRHRTIEIGQPGDIAYEAICWLLHRARDLGARDPEHFLFPFRMNRPVTAAERAQPFDPRRGMTVSGIKNHWIEVRNAANLRWFRPYDTRHTGITRLAECGVSMSIIMKMAGHISPKMTEHYTHISEGLGIEAARKVQREMRGEAAPLILQPAAPAPPQPRSKPATTPIPQPKPAAVSKGSQAPARTFASTYFFLPQLNRTA